MEVQIEKFDDLGRGITHIDGKVTFVPLTVPGDIVKIKLVQEKKKYNEAMLLELVSPSPLRIDAKCPYFLKCGGCQLQTLKYEDTIKYKRETVTNLFAKNKISIYLEPISNSSPYNYRNKVSLKVNAGKLGFYSPKTHKIEEINQCFIANPAINECISLVKDFGIMNGEVTIRCNQNSEVLIIIKSDDTINIDIKHLQEKLKLVGIVINDETYYGVNYLFERINNYLFKISYDAFFQVNPYIASRLFKLISDNITPNDKVLDLYCGVGTLSLVAASKAEQVIGIEIVPNAILNAVANARFNNLNNVSFLLNDAKEAIDKVKMDFTKVIIDPPRSGLDKKTIDVLLKIQPKSIIYVSCNPQTLVRDYKLLSDKYEINAAYILDMFSYTYHMECVCILESRKTCK